MASKAGSKMDRQLSEDVSMKERLKRGWDLLRILYRNEFTRGLGRDLLFFGGSIFVIKTIISGLSEEALPTGGP
ncbi:hypothetical protein EMCRGX_G001551 [Ephydatia muelleri]